ncbi:MAG: hypothetical protein Q8R28_22325 [Dehalococcoidia bacterium]|nr:hypothetical protein [Dehalococcoidia bacterium]
MEGRFSPGCCSWCGLPGSKTMLREHEPACEAAVNQRLAWRRGLSPVARHPSLIQRAGVPISHLRTDYLPLSKRVKAASWAPRWAVTLCVQLALLGVSRREIVRLLRLGPDHPEVQAVRAWEVLDQDD